MAKIGLYLCGCGPNVSDAIDLDRIAAAVEADGTVAGVERHKLLCSEDGRKFLAETIREHGYDRVVLAACSPKQHQATFEGVLADAGLNPQMLQMVNVREQCAWSTPDREQATGKALRMIRAAVGRVRYHRPLEQREIDCNPDLLVVGAGVAGIETALRAAGPDRRVWLVSREELGGGAAGQSLARPGRDAPADFVAARARAVREHPRVEVFERSRVVRILGFFGNFVTTLTTADGNERELRSGAVVLATGAHPVLPEGTLGYGRLDRVFTPDAFDPESFSPPAGRAPAIAVVHCAGREQLGYCSGSCCLHAMKLARRIRQALPEAEVTEFYRDICLPAGVPDSFWHETAGAGVRFVRYEEVSVTESGDGVTVACRSGENQGPSVSADAVVLVPGLVPDPETAELAGMLNLALDDRGFLTEEHAVLNPVGTTADGIYVVGGCRGPATLDEAVAQAAAAAGKVLSALVPGRRLPLEVRTSEVADRLCVGCGTCVEVCAYGAVALDEERRVAVVNEVLCRGCGNCASACPSGAARHRHFTTGQLEEEMTELLR